MELIKNITQPVVKNVVQKFQLGSKLNYWSSLINPFRQVELTGTDAYRFVGSTIQSPLNSNLLVNIYTHGQAHDYELGKVIKIRKSTDKGLSWGVETTIYSPGGNWASMGQASGYSISGRLHVIVTDSDVYTYRSTNRLMYIYSDDEGETWSAPENITASIADVTYPMFRAFDRIIENDGALICPVYMTNGDAATETNVKVLRFDGTNWTSVTVITNSGFSNYENEGSLIALSNSELILMVRREGGEDYRQFQSSDNGLTWTNKGVVGFWMDIPTTAQPAALSSFVEEGETIIECVFPRHYEGSKPLYSIYAKATDLIKYGYFGWNNAFVKQLLDNHTEVTKYGNNVHANNDYRSIGVFSRLNSNAGNICKMEYFLNDTTDYNTFKNVMFPVIPTNDNDAEDYITLIGITDADTIAEIRAFVYELKKEGIWDKILAAYPFIGGTSDTHKINIKDLRDMDAAFRLNFINGAGAGWTHNSEGVKGDGTGSYANTFLIPSTHLTLYSAHLGIYTITGEVGSYHDVGGWKTVTGIAPGLTINVRNTSSGGRFYCYRHSGDTTDGVAYNNADGKGFSLGTRIGESNCFVINKRNMGGISTVATTNQQGDKSLYIGASNQNGVAGFFSPRKYGYATIGHGLTRRESNIYTNLVNRLQIVLGRSVD